MDNDEVLRRNADAYHLLRTDSVTAWIDPDGIVHVTPLFRHLDFFVQNAEILQDITADLIRHANADGDVRMPGHLMADFMDRIYGRGWGRIGTFGGDKLELDCGTDHMRVLRRKAKMLARMVGRDLVCNVTEPGQNPKRKQKAQRRDAYWSSLRPGFAGWLSPEGTIHETSPYEPFSTFVDEPRLIPELQRPLGDAIAEDRVAQADEFDLSYASEEHVPWHQFDHSPYNPREGELAVMTAIVTGSGWGRLHVDGNGILRLEADPGFLHDLEEALRKAVAPTGIRISADAAPTSASIIR